MLLLRFVAFALLPKPMISAVRMALLPLPFWPTNKFVRVLKSTVRFEWHMKFRNFTVKILPLRTPKSNSPKSAVELAMDIPIPSSFGLVNQCNREKKCQHTFLVEQKKTVENSYSALTSSLESSLFCFVLFRPRFDLSWVCACVDLRLAISLSRTVWTTSKKKSHLRLLKPKCAHSCCRSVTDSLVFWREFLNKSFTNRLNRILTCCKHVSNLHDRH